MKKVLFSGIQPSGILHIGNYLGAIKQWVKLQHDYEAFFCVVDEHAITVPQEPKELRENILRNAMLYIAAGIDPQKSTIFIQSHVPAHAELAWILNTITPLGELERMTQFKDKAHIKKDFWREAVEYFTATNQLMKQLNEILNKKIGYLNSPSQSNRNLLSDLEKQELEVNDQIGEEGYSAIEKFLELEKTRGETGAGLFNYPTLMAADILLYQTDVVPVGEDQKQHIELTRSLAKRFNNKFGETFKIPEGFIPKETARIMGLDDPTKKMSKSAASANNYIALLDPADEIRRKVKIAVTDSGKQIVYDEEEKPAIANLMRIFAAFAGREPDDIEKQYQDKSYSYFKRDLSELLVEKLSPLQTRYKELSDDKKSVLDILRRGAEHANSIAEKTLRTTQEKIGFLVQPVAIHH